MDREWQGYRLRNTVGEIIIVVNVATNSHISYQLPFTVTDSQTVRQSEKQTVNIQIVRKSESQTFR